MALLPWGKVDIGTNRSPKETTQMSSEVKYIGMDVHKEAIVNAVCNSTGQLVMESNVETKASSILQCIRNEAIAWLQWIGNRNDRRAEPEKPRMGGIRTKNSARARYCLS